MSGMILQPGIADATLPGLRLPCFDCLHFAGEALGMAGYSPCPLRTAAGGEGEGVEPILDANAAISDCPGFEPG